MQIYLDYSATTPPHPDAIAIMQRVMASEWGNPSSLHQWGVRAATYVEQARISVASLVNAPIDGIVFTSGGTEANNLAILGTARRYHRPQHLIISSVEHSAIAEPARLLEQQGWRVTRLPVGHQGRVSPKDLEMALQPDTVLVSVIYAQSEVGTLQPVQELGAIARRHGALFHTDAVQVAGRLPLDVQQLPVDMLSLSSHKIYGPQGAGALYVRSGLPLVPLLGGGGQERGLRSGTQATPAIAGFGVAAALASKALAVESVRLQQLRNRLWQQLKSESRLRLTGDPVHRLPHHLSFYLPHGDGAQLSGKTLVRQMNLAGIGISAGSACHSGKLSPSPILKAMGYGDRAAKCGIRLSLGCHTTEADVDWVAMALRQVLDRCPAPALAPV
ncbi:MAG: cysteine desulfurase family protein [Elainellaceae cyanobacterium]